MNWKRFGRSAVLMLLGSIALVFARGDAALVRADDEGEEVPDSTLGASVNERKHGPHSVSAALTETTVEAEWGYENRDASGEPQEPYLGAHGQSWDEIWWYVTHRYDANSEQVSMNHGFILIKPDYITGVIGAGQLVNPANEDPRRTELDYRAQDNKQLTCTLAGDGPGHLDIIYSSTLYVRAGGHDSQYTSGKVGALAYGLLGLAVDGDWTTAQAAVMRSNEPQDSRSGSMKTMLARWRLATMAALRLPLLMKMASLTKTASRARAHSPNSAPTRGPDRTTRAAASTAK